MRGAEELGSVLATVPDRSARAGPQGTIRPEPRWSPGRIGTNGGAYLAAQEQPAVSPALHSGQAHWPSGQTQPALASASAAAGWGAGSFCPLEHPHIATVSPTDNHRAFMRAPLLRGRPCYLRRPARISLMNASPTRTDDRGQGEGDQGPIIPPMHAHAPTSSRSPTSTDGYAPTTCWDDVQPPRAVLDGSVWHVQPLFGGGVERGTSARGAAALQTSAAR